MGDAGGQRVKMVNWNYGDAYLRHPIRENQVALFRDGSKLMVHDIFEPLPSFLKKADLVFVDPPWNLGNLNTFYTKAALKADHQSFTRFYIRLFECIREIAPKTCYVEVGKDYLGEFLLETKKIYKHVTFFNSTYYHRKNNLCYVIRGGLKRKKLPLDGEDEEDIIAWICKNEEYQCIGDLCMGQGLVAVNAALNKRRFVGTELNPKRLSVALEHVQAIGLSYKLQEVF